MSLAPLVLAALLPVAGAAPAQGMRCTEPLPVGMASWADPIALKGGDMLPIGTAARLTMMVDAEPVVAPEKPAAAGSFGGTLRFRVTRAGRYRVALSGPVWVEVVQGGRRLRSVAHGHGGQCSPIRKKVDFALKPGRYTLQLSGSDRTVVTVFAGPAS